MNGSSKMQSNVIVMKSKNEIVPTGYTQHILPVYTTAFGLAMVVDGELFTKTYDEQIVEIYQQLNDGIQIPNKDLNIIFNFAKDDSGKFQPEDLQPFTILSDGNKKLLVAFLDGNFPDYSHASAHSKEFYCVNEYLIPMITKLYELVNKDMTKLLGYLNTSGSTHKDLCNIASGPNGYGSIVLFANTGEVIHFDNNKGFGTYPWGWTTNTLNYTDGLKTKEGLQQKIGAALGLPSRTEMKTTVSLPLATLLPKIKPPAGKSNKEIKLWYRINNAEVDPTVQEPGNGMLPPDWERRPAITIKASRINYIPELVEILKTQGTSAAPDGDKSAGKDTAPHNIPQPPTTPSITEAPPWKETPFIINPKELPQAIAFVQKIDLNNQPLSLDEIDKAEKKNKTFIETMGLETFDRVLKMKPEAIGDFVDKFPDSAKLLIRDFIHKTIRLERTITELSDTIAGYQLDLEESEKKSAAILAGAASPSKTVLGLPTRKTA
jgi:hypothetical protein